MMLAVREGHRSMAEFLMEHGADVNAEDEAGNTALSMAAKHDRRELAELLLKKKADVNHKNEAGDTPLMIAVEQGWTEMVELLLKMDIMPCIGLPTGPGKIRSALNCCSNAVCRSISERNTAEERR